MPSSNECLLQKIWSGYLIDQSICTLICNSEFIRLTWYFFRVWNFKKNWVQYMECKKQGAKNKAIAIRKEKRQPGLFFFWITMTLLFASCFLPLLLAPHILDPILFQGCKPTHVFKTKIVGADWLGECIALDGAVQLLLCLINVKKLKTQGLFTFWSK